MKHAILSSIVLLSALAAGSRAHAADDVAKLKAKLAAVTAEADALWIYVQSSGDNPNIGALNRAMALYEKRNYGRHRK